VAEAARRLSCRPASSATGSTPGSWPPAAVRATRFCIPWNDETEAGCRARIQQSAHRGRTARPRKLPAPAVSRR